MTLQDVLDQLTYGELSQVEQGGLQNTDENGDSAPGMNESQVQRTLGHVQLGLTALYKRFRLREKQVNIRLVPDKVNYVLKAEFVASNTASDVINRYLIDTDDPFDAVLLKVEDVFAVNPNPLADKYEREHKLPLNRPGNMHTVKTPSMHILQIPDHFGLEYEPEELRVVYRASHPTLDQYTAVAAPIAIPIELPTTHLQALLYYVASRVMNPIGMVQEFHSGNSYYAKYESECQRLELENLQIDDQAENHHFHTQGFI